MKPPHLRRCLLLEAPDRLPDGAGGFTQAWTTLGEHWAEVTALPGREVTTPGGSLSQSGYRITLRATPPGHAMRPRPDQRLRDGARLFTILAVSERDPAGRYLTCLCREEMSR
jgi:head-tail adaptor